MAFCKTCGTQIPDGTNQCANCAAKNGTPAANPAPFSPADASGMGGFNPDAASGGFDFSGGTSQNSGKSKKGFIILGIAAVILVAVLVFIFNFLFSGYKKPIKNVVKGVNKIDIDKAAHAIIPKNQFKDFEEMIEDQFDDSYKSWVKDTENDVKDEIKDNKLKYKVKVNFKGKKKVNGSTRDDIEEYVSEMFEEMGLDEVEVKKAYRVKVYIEAEAKYKKEKANAGTTINIYVVKYRGSSGWYIAPYFDEECLGEWADLMQDMYGGFDLDDLYQF